MVLGFGDYVEPTPKGPSNYPFDLLQSFRQSMDPLADRVYEALRAEQPDKHFGPGVDLVKCIEERAKQEADEGVKDGIFSEFWTAINTLPPWYDHAKIENGKKLLISAGIPAAFSLTTCSLVSSYGAAQGSQVLTQTGRFAHPLHSPFFSSFTAPSHKKQKQNKTKG